MLCMSNTLLAIAAICSGTAVTQLPQEVTDRIRGKIVLEDGTPAEGISVFPALPTGREKYRTKTSETGTFTLRFPPTTFFFRLTGKSINNAVLSFQKDLAEACMPEDCCNGPQVPWNPGA